jgi:hypothetical protein
MIATDLPQNAADYRSRSWLWPSGDARVGRLTGRRAAAELEECAAAVSLERRPAAGRAGGCRPAPGELAAAAGSAAAAATATAARSRCRSGPAADGDRRQQLDGVVVALRAGRRVGRLAHRTGLLEGVSAGPASVLVSWHRLIVCRRAPWPLLPGRAAPAAPVPRGASPRMRGIRNRRPGTAARTARPSGRCCPGAVRRPPGTGRSSAARPRPCYRCQVKVAGWWLFPWAVNRTGRAPVYTSVRRVNLSWPVPWPRGRARQSVMSAW